ncbi:GNAT family N-acetyltransferase [Nocardia sp. NPDC059195]|uniref:GNAT family N-acetyltransferase n=1 Tax=Nocardia sp. NPDC059195 TaxID=3346765 RepID=UPI0036C626B5
MTSLVRPAMIWAASWTDTVRDFGALEAMNGSGHWHAEQVEATAEGCARFIATVLASESADPAGTRVASTYYWIADCGPQASVDGEIVGFLSLRHELNEFLRAEGGHIGYSIRPARRRQGHATRALALALARAAELGIDDALVTCDDNNVASARAIERCGGTLDDVHNGKRRYWIRTTASTDA